MVGLYWIPNIIVLGCICDIPHRPFCNNCNIVISFPRTCKRDCKQIFLAINNWCSYCRRFGNIFNQSVLIAYTRTIIPIPRLGDFVVGNKVFFPGDFLSFLPSSCHPFRSLVTPAKAGVGPYSVSKANQIMFLIILVHCMCTS